MKKKLVSLVLSLIMIVGLLPVNTFAVETDLYAGYDVVTVSAQTEFESAITNVQNTPTKIVLADGDYTMPNVISVPQTSTPKNIVFKGSKNAIINMYHPGVNVPYSGVYASGCEITFDGVTVLFNDTDDYEGIYHVNKVVYRDCIINGKQLLFAPTVEFTNCTLVNKNDYCIWTWAASDKTPVSDKPDSEITFTGCTFNSGGKAILVYTEWGAGYEVDGKYKDAYKTAVNLTDCIFNDDNTLKESDGSNLKKAAVEAGSSPYSTKVFHEITFTNCTINGFSANNSTSPLWGNKNSMDYDHLIVNIDGVYVHVPAYKSDAIDTILQFAAEQKTVIDELPYLSPERKEELKAEIDEIVAESIESINGKANVGDEAEVAAETSKSLDEIYAVVKEGIEENAAIEAQKKTVRFDANGGTASYYAAVTGTDGRLSGLPTAIREGYTFGGWFMDRDGHGEVTYGTVFDQNTTVYAYWMPQDIYVPYIDVPTDAWYFDSVMFTYYKGLMNGVGGYEFAPDKTLNRATLVTTLWRLSGSPKVANGNTFTDLQEGTWYTDAMKWAVANGIIEGYGDNTCRPLKDVTHQEVCAILRRYAALNGRNVGAPSWVYGAPKYSTWAKDDALWAVNNGVYATFGSDVSDLTKTATRGEVAAYLQVICELLGK